MDNIFKTHSHAAVCDMQQTVEPQVINYFFKFSCSLPVYFEKGKYVALIG